MVLQRHAPSIKRAMLATLASLSFLPLEGGALKGRRLALLAIARGLAPSYQSLLILDALIPIYYLQGGTHI